MSSSRFDLSSLGVITVVFNPIRYQTRYRRYWKFKSHMARSGVDLLTVECLFQSSPHLGLPEQRFEVTRPNNPKDLQIVAPSVLWMKENLINIAAQQFPPHVRYIAWIDADVEFERLDWPVEALKVLQRYPIVQLFRVGYFTGPGGKTDILRKDHSFGYSIRHHKPLERDHPNWYSHPGYAWAMDRRAFNAIGGLLDFCIVGSADLHFAYALVGRIDETYPHGLCKDYRQLAQNWANRLTNVAAGGKNVGYLNTTLFHRWHGSRESRSYVNRWAILIGHDFSPVSDLIKDEQTQVIALKKKSFLERLFGNQRLEQMERAIVEYFISRNEDERRIIPKPRRPRPSRVPRRRQQHRRRTGRGGVRGWFPQQAGGSSPSNLFIGGDFPQQGGGEYSRTSLIITSGGAY